MKPCKTIRTSLVLLSVLIVAPALAEGPLNVGGPGDANGVPFRWDPAIFPLTYWTDLGNLGSRTTSQADDLAASAFTIWQDVQTSSISFSRAGQLGGDVTSANYFALVDAVNDCSTLPGNPSAIGRPRNVIYDTDGSIINLVFGAGQSGTTLGFAYPTCLTSDLTNNLYNRSIAVMNGLDTTDAELRAIMIHEFGHMLGLDHSQVNVECNPFGCFDPDAAAGLPTMFPFLIDEAEMSTPAVDDIAGLSALYPGPTFATTTGTITGHIFFSDGQTQAQNFNVVARLVDEPSTPTIDESKITAVSSVSGFLFTGDNGNPIYNYFGSPSLNGTREEFFYGYYEIPGLPPGNYTIEVEAIDPDFTFGSGLGPVGLYGIVFRMPSSACPSGEFYNTSDPNNDVCTDQTPITVDANTTAPDKNIILNGTPPRYDDWETGP